MNTDIFQAVPPGWRFYSADFSLNAHDSTRSGTVVLRRDEPGYRWWLSLPDADRETAKLYVHGRGVTFTGALADAVQMASDARGVK